MSDYSKLIDDLRRCRKTDDRSCEGCSYIKDMKTSFCWLIAMSDAADAIEELQEQVRMLDKHDTDLHNEGYDVGYYAGRRDWEPKHGEWIWDNYYWHCSECGENPTKGTGYVQSRAELFRYCPNCGAKMGVQDD